MTNQLATRIAGSSDLYESGGRAPYHSINFITSHDGFTLNDLVSYNEKHNEANGEQNRDGDNNSFSCNYGVEGPAKTPALRRFRRRHIRNFLATLFFSHGVPMLLMGDECRRTQDGNNNAYCQDNDLSWMDWELIGKNADLVRFVSSLIRFRRSEPTLRRREFLTGQPVGLKTMLPDVSWYRHDGRPFDWTDTSCPTLVCMFAAVPSSEKSGGAPDGELRSNHILLICHNGQRSVSFRLPDELRMLSWRLFVNTAAAPPNDIYPSLDGPELAADKELILPPFSLHCFLAPDTE